MKTKLFAAALAALALAGAMPAAAQNYRGGDDYRRGGDWRRAEITVRKDGRTFSFDRGDRMFYRLIDQPFRFRPGLTYSYTDRCNRNGCVAFVFDGRSRRPIDRIFAPHLREARGYAWREGRGLDRSYHRYGSYDRDDRSWDNDHERSYRDGRDDRGDRNWDDDRDDRGARDDRGGDRDWNRDGNGRRDSQRDDGSGLEGGRHR